MMRFLSILLLKIMILSSQTAALADTSPDQKAVLITGASSGLGRVMAETLAADGYFVYAGARIDKDLEELSAIENIQGVRLDVNKQDQIDAAVKIVSEAGRGLYGLVNNAGVAVVQPLIEIEEEDFDFQMNVNVYGPYRVTRAFAQLIIESKGRISTIGSISGTLSSATWGPYSMTKFAMEAFADALADEMRPFGVQVSLIEPGAYRSDIGKSALERMAQRNQSADDSAFKDAMTESVDWLSMFEKDHGDPAEVAAAVKKALFDQDPKPRYLVVPTKEQAYWTINRAIERMVEQNHDQKHTYDREALIEMLDAALAKQSGATSQVVSPGGDR
jgi:NAD(P)-dependent dehydrogenase (short-subunit alcohol dehydrogenase family)